MQVKDICLFTRRWESKHKLQVSATQHRDVITDTPSIGKGWECVNSNLGSSTVINCANPDLGQIGSTSYTLKASFVENFLPVGSSIFFQLQHRPRVAELSIMTIVKGVISVAYMSYFFFYREEC